MHVETVETYTNVYARWFAIISQFIVTASLCTLWQLQMTRYSQVLVHSTVVNSQLSHLSATFCQVFSSFLAGFGCCFGDFCCFSYFFSAFFRLLGWVWVLFWGFLLFQLLFLGSFPAFELGFGCCFRDFCCFSYFL